MMCIDDLVCFAINELYPDQTTPDENNFLPNGDQYKAPDHAIFDGKILIERKSWNSVDNSQFYEKLRAIAESQGKPFNGYGLVNSAKIIEKLPDPGKATRKIKDYEFNPMVKHIKNSRKKFEEYSKYNEYAGQLRVMVISDHTTSPGSNDAQEQFLGRKMGGYSSSDDISGVIDSIIYIKHPSFVFDVKNSYWFKCLIKRRLSQNERNMIEHLSIDLHNLMIRHEILSEFANQLHIERYRPLIV